MIGLSVLIIAKNEADRIEKAIRSVSFADEIVVLDSGSTDQTIQVAEKLGAKVFSTDWPGHVEQKNRSLKYANQPWILSIDADEVVSPELQQEIIRVLENSEADGYFINRRSFYFDKPLKGGDWYPDPKVRLAKVRFAQWKGTDPHDLLFVEGKISSLKADLYHYPYRNSEEHLITIDRYTTRFVEITCSKAHWYDLVFRPFWRFLSSFILKKGYRDGALGLMLSFLSAAYTSMKWTKLWLKQHKSTDKRS